MDDAASSSASEACDETTLAVVSEEGDGLVAAGESSPHPAAMSASPPTRDSASLIATTLLRERMAGNAEHTDRQFWTELLA